MLAEPKDNLPLISVIVPVYNGESYLRSCIESIENQTYQKLEIIIINDGSTDGTGKVCVDLKETYEKALREALMRYQGKEASTWNQKLLDTENDPERRKLLEQIGQKIRELDFEEAESIFRKWKEEH